MRQVLNQARADGHRPRVHGNGFVQLDLNDVSHMHLFGHPEVPRQRTPLIDGQTHNSGIHDHRFSFQSQVLTGCLIHTEFLIQENGVPKTHAVYSPNDTPDKMRHADFAATGQLVAVVALPTKFYRKGMFYTFEMREFHETHADEPTLTLMNKTATDMRHTVRILVPLQIAASPDLGHPVQDEDVLWRLLEEAVGRL